MIAAPPEALVGLPGRVAWNPLPKQRLFLYDYASVDELLFGGAAGGSKSEALLLFSVLRRMEYPASKGLILRRSYPELMMGGGLIPRSHELLHGVGHWNGDAKTWTFKNESVLQFGHLVHENSWTVYYGSAWEDVAFDELTLFTFRQYLMVGLSRGRSVIPGCRPKLRATTNPGNEGHVWVRERFIEPLPSFKVGWFVRRRDQDVRLTQAQAALEPLAKSRAFVPSRLEDNPYLFTSGFYEANLSALTEDDYRALRWGDWYAWSGQVFKRWRTDRHVVEPRRLSPDMPRFAGLDWGYSSPFVCLFLAAGERMPSDPEPLAPCDRVHVYVHREVTLTQQLDEQQRDAVLASLDDGEVITHWSADPASFFQRDRRTGLTPADWWALKGVRLEPSNNDRVFGKRAVDSYLSDCACGVPCLRVFSTCDRLIKTLPSLGYDARHVEDVQKGPDDHHYDALRYALMGLVPTGQAGGHGSHMPIDGRYA